MVFNDFYLVEMPRRAIPKEQKSARERERQARYQARPFIGNTEQKVGQNNLQRALTYVEQYRIASSGKFEIRCSQSDLYFSLEEESRL